MVDKRRIRLMTKLAVYEQSDAKEDMKISGYYKKDYVGMKTVIGAIWATIGYVMAAVLLVLCAQEKLIENLSVQNLILLAGAVIVGYFVTLIVYCVCAGTFYGAKYTKAIQQIKKFYNHLSHLERLETHQNPTTKGRQKKAEMKTKPKAEENAL